ncbi:MULTISPECIES: formate dehydrogenase subunit delta [unclassified Paraburkholderia]|uniref:formate dehydrogenase subunit delta n=1 Tax=unclassified Paraburkholderia TaxID=2615204 RepID=UPI00161A279C|nr:MULTISPECIES: formate dehydrogenase subunit delta [unclassified Paraburkholderia]MBB5409450.1 formate dehydrogenase subunit delta [Paraburkholderia sp. HC6.4b]MBB5451180.1 formate dehydrogenase subunit delta [Paraburkholderia sp. Kb1A]MBB5459069.1 formate dehydrogenase subunit delta [Paraburkholderia sp. Cpub6]MBB5501472.1 formate dehydrogenase subunit delta [Paraburkholderia sp. MM5384-R2]MBC8739069.1 formate dehydrogenase subunit delta [Paraburkholderia sp. UCT31]
MDNRNLIDMANRIGDFFESMPDHEEALTGVAEHIRRFWEPRMRRALLATLDEAPDTYDIALSDFTREAIVRYREKLTPAPAQAPAA